MYDRALLEFVGRVPRGVLVGASTRVRAYTRALRYLEEQIRTEHAARRTATGRRSVRYLFFYDTFARFPRSFLQGALLNYLRSVVKAFEKSREVVFPIRIRAECWGVGVHVLNGRIAKKTNTNMKSPSPLVCRQKCLFVVFVYVTPPILSVIFVLQPVIRSPPSSEFVVLLLLVITTYFVSLHSLCIFLLSPAW